MPLIVTEPGTERLETGLAAQREPMLIGRLTIAEASSAISRKRRMDELDETAHAVALQALDAFVAAVATIVDHEASDIAEAAMLVRRPTPKLLSPDAIHLATSRRLGAVPVTDDAGLASAAANHGVTHVLPA